MLATIELDDQFITYTNKINDIRSNGVLAPKLGAVQVPA
ncbi:MAG: hypothetical protein RJA24_1480, partial [Pseudomonadota bacterium]